MKKADLEIEALTEALKLIGRTFPELATTLDRITEDHTAFESFLALVHAKGAYRPSIQKAPAEYDTTEIVWFVDRTITRGTFYAELDLLALAYDLAQAARGDNRRAFRS